MITLITLLFGATARAQSDDIQLIDTPPPAPSAPPLAPGEVEIRGMHCTPDVKEVETRRTIPISCTVDYPVAGVELRYRVQGASKKWDKLDLKQADGSYTGAIPCTLTNQPGTLELYLFARNENNKVIARVGRHETPLTVKLVEHSNSTPPSLPGQQAPERCYDPNACPPEKLGTAACPGTQVPKPSKKSWGATCGDTSECASGLECVKGSCDTPSKCETANDCGEGAECTDGVCHVPTAAELKTRIGPPKHHWLGLHAGVDFNMMQEGTGVCGSSTDDSQHFNCFEGGNEYAGVPNNLYAGHVKSSLYFATVRAMLSYDYAFARMLLGARLGWAFRGAPKDFSPIHIEVRAHYSLVRKPFDEHFRPYLGLVVGHAQVDSYAPTIIVDCTSADPINRANCAKSTDKTQLAEAIKDPNQAVQRQLNAYHSGSPFFFGPSLELMYAISNEAAFVFNFMVMLPNVTFEPTVGFQMGL